MKDGELRMSQRELHRLHIVRLTLEGRESVGRGAKFLGISVRQMKRLRRKMKERGVEGLLHGNQGKSPWNKTVSAKVKQVLALARGRYQGLNDTHLTEKLKEKEKMALSRPVVRTILRQAGIAAVRRRGVKRHYKRRERRAQEGALLLWDGSPHRWFGDEHGEWTLTAVIDDATGALLHGMFSLEEDAQSYLICLRQIVLDKGIPLALYMDRHGISAVTMTTGACTSNSPGNRRQPRSVRRCGPWALSRSLPCPRRPKVGWNDCLIRCRIV